MNSFRIGSGYDVHALAAGLPLRLGGVNVPHTKGCVAHSDGDVLIHALCDALLGALSLGDIGLHFPDTDPAYKGMDSTLLLERCYAMVKARGYALGNADLTLVLQKPKIAPYVDRMRESLAQVMQVPLADISVKATTSERLGFTGREEGVAAFAVVLLQLDDNTLPG